jgi:hypothetical protein
LDEEIRVECLAINGESSLAEDAQAVDVFTIGHCVFNAGMTLQGQGHAVHCRLRDEIVGRTGVEQRQEGGVAELETDLHVSLVRTPVLA